MGRYVTILATLAALAVAIPATALHGACVDGVSDPEITTCPEEGMPCTVYFDEDLCGYYWNFWIYAESNGIHGLQRSDEGWGPQCRGAYLTCPGHEPDMLIF